MWKNERPNLANKLIKYYIKHYDELIITTVRITKSYGDAEDVMQNVALALCKREKELEHVENCGAFIAVCIRRAAISLFRHKAHERVTDPYFLEIYQENSRNRLLEVTSSTCPPANSSTCVAAGKRSTRAISSAA